MKYDELYESVMNEKESDMINVVISDLEWSLRYIDGGLKFSKKIFDPEKRKIALAELPKLQYQIKSLMDELSEI